jgi:uncharacterized membrane protein
MFEFLFKYPAAVFSKGEFVLLGGWPKWVLALLLLATAAGLALLIRSRRPQAAPSVRNWRLSILWLLQALVAAVVLLLLWQPAIMVAQLNPQQNIIAVVVDASRSMGISENGATREAQAVKALQGGVLGDLGKKFQTRLYRLDSGVTRIAGVEELKPSAPATHIGESLKQLVDETAGLPVGAIVLLSDGADNSGGIDRDTVAALRSRRIPVHTVGFGLEQVGSDLEIDDVSVAPSALADSRLAARVSFHQRGFAGRKTVLRVRDGDKVLAVHEVTLAGDGTAQTDSLLFNVGPAGAKSLQFTLDPLPGEANPANNSMSRLVNVESGARRVLYMEGEPRWEYKFIRRAEDDDHSVELVSILRTTENKIYTQGVDPANPKELADGFPKTAEDLFRYQGLIIGSVEAGYFNPAQQDLIQQFADRRGGGVLLLAGSSSLADGGWGASSMAGMLPVVLPGRKGTFHRDPATAELTPAGAESIICRLVEDPARNDQAWKKLPYLMNYQDPGTPKPGAAVLAEMTAGGRKMPLLITENYGRGRTAVLATEGTWRWQMNLPVGDPTHKDFWQQLLRWLVADTPGPVVASVSNPVLYDDARVQFSAEVRGKDYQPLPDAQVEAHILGPGGTAASVTLTQDPNSPGVFQGEWTAEQPGSYTTEVAAKRGDEEIGRDVLMFQRVDGVAENFHTEQNRPLLEKLASETGGQYWRPQDLSRLPGEISYSDAGISVRETKELWNMPAVFLLLLALCASEWLLRRKWGIV